MVGRFRAVEIDRTVQAPSAGSGGAAVFAVPFPVVPSGARDPRLNSFVLASLSSMDFIFTRISGFSDINNNINKPIGTHSIAQMALEGRSASLARWAMTVLFLPLEQR